jgi:hypothetical protein
MCRARARLGLGRAIKIHWQADKQSLISLDSPTTASESWTRPAIAGSGKPGYWHARDMMSKCMCVTVTVRAHVRACMRVCVCARVRACL